MAERYEQLRLQGHLDTPAARGELATLARAEAVPLRALLQAVDSISVELRALGAQCDAQDGRDISGTLLGMSAALEAALCGVLDAH
jgi:hypothetical protein